MSNIQIELLVFWLNVLCSVLGKTLARTTGFLLLAEHKPCYVRAMEICSTFSAANPMNMVAWGRIELPTRGFSIRCSTN
jgi:hypothetical protein